MQYQQAVRLGVLHRQLGIPTTARTFVQIMTDGPLGTYIWDLDSENTYIMVQGHPNNPILPGRRAVPQYVKDIIAATDSDLKNQWLTTEGWNEVRETVFSELTFRGIDILRLEGIR